MNEVTITNERIKSMVLYYKEEDDVIYVYQQAVSTPMSINEEIRRWILDKEDDD